MLKVLSVLIALIDRELGPRETHGKETFHETFHIMFVGESNVEVRESMNAPSTRITGVDGVITSRSIDTKKLDGWCLVGQLADDVKEIIRVEVDNGARTWVEIKNQVAQRTSILRLQRTLPESLEVRGEGSEVRDTSISAQ